MSSDHSADPARWLETHVPVLHVVLARSVLDPLLAFDLAAETLAGAANCWTEHDAARDGPRLSWLMPRAQQLLAAAVEREEVPSIERRRNRIPKPTRLTDHDVASGRLAAIAGG